MSERSSRDGSSPHSSPSSSPRIDAWSDGDGGYEGDGGKAVDSSREPAVALLRAEAALAAARNEIALLRARVERLQEDNERLEARVSLLDKTRRN